MKIIFYLRYVLHGTKHVVIIDCFKLTEKIFSQNIFINFRLLTIRFEMMSQCKYDHANKIMHCATGL